MTADELVGKLERAQIGYELIPHRQTRTAGVNATAPASKFAFFLKMKPTS